MITEKRHDIILTLLKQKGLVHLAEMVEATNSSESSIRRDLSYLESCNLLKRVHGGAKFLTSTSEELSYNQKKSKNLHYKRSIGQYAASLVQENDCIYLDAGTSTYEMIPHLQGKNVFVVTNGIQHIDTLMEYGISTHMIGGKVKPSTKAIIGSEALKSLEKFHFDKCFLGTNGVDKRFGLTTPDSEEAVMKECAIAHSKISFVLADESKFDNISFIKFADVNTCIIITNKKPDTQEYSDRTNIQEVTH